ncbi:MAG: substrate-binding domain-containing protein [Victivallaceae bacterium]|nr:substrate-binding domain-containing protein [Victivallaceae bacterium]
MKKCLLMAAALLILCGCGDSGEKKLRIGISVPSATHGWTGGVVWSAERAEKNIEAANPDVDVMIATSANTAAQVDAIENLLMQNIDALVVLSQEPEPLDNVCRQAKTRGVYLVVVSNPLPSGAQDVFVNGDNASFGAAAGEAMGQALNGKGDILVLEGFLCPINTERVESFKKVLADKYPGIRILDSQPTDWNTERGLKVMESYLQKYPKIDGVWAGDDDVLLGVLTAYAESKRTDVKAMVGGGGSRAIVRKVMDKDPVVKATVTYPPQMVEVGAAKALDGLRNGGKPVGGEVEIIVKSEVVTPDNAAAYYFPDSRY